MIGPLFSHLLIFRLGHYFGPGHFFRLGWAEYGHNFAYPRLGRVEDFFGSGAEPHQGNIWAEKCGPAYGDPSSQYLTMLYNLLEGFYYSISSKNKFFLTF